MNLNISLDSLDFIVDNKQLEKYIGHYVDISDSENIIELFFENDILILKRINQRDTPIFSLSSDKVFFSRLDGFYRFEDNSDSLGIKMTSYKGHRSKTYAKVNTIE